MPLEHLVNTVKKLALFPGHLGGENWPGIDCLCMCNHSLGICSCLEIVGKINTYTSDIFP